jgi:hypothetical protein
MILHYTSPANHCAAPAEFISVERMILRSYQRQVFNHCLHRDELGGGLKSSRPAKKQTVSGTNEALWIRAIRAIRGCTFF